MTNYREANYGIQRLVILIYIMTWVASPYIRGNIQEVGEE